MATGDLTTLDNVKAYLGTQSNADDALLSGMITSYSAYIQQWLNRTIAQTTYHDTRDGNGSQVLVLGNYPVISVSSVTVGLTVIPASAGYGQSGYVFDNKSVILTGYSFTRARQNVFITYSAGYATTPSEIERACIELVALRYREKDRIGHSSKSMASETVSFITKDFPDSVKTILNNYRKVIPL